jgi:hypothetical protein
MKRYFYFPTFFILLILITASCGADSNANSNAMNAGNANVNAANHGQMPIPRNDEATENSAPTIAPVVQQFYDALKAKDDAKLKETLTTQFEKTIEEDMRSQGEKSIAVFVAKSDYRPGQEIEVRNEKINGNKAVAELRGGAYKNWTAFEFAQENGKWRFTGGSPDIDNMPKSNVNTAH